MNKYPFYTALSQCQELYDIEMTEDQFETWGMTAWNKIGNKECKLITAKAYPLKDLQGGGWYICKPCDLDSIEAITLPYEDAPETSVSENNPGPLNHNIEQSIEWDKFMPHAFYIPGKYVKYRELGDKIYFTEPFHEVHVLYKEMYADENGLPYINDKEAFAIATYCAYTYFFKLGLKAKDLNSIQLAGILKLDWNKACNAARVAKSISQNEANEILDAQSSWDRHNFGRTTKPIK